MPFNLRIGKQVAAGAQKKMIFSRFSPLCGYVQLLKTWKICAGGVFVACYLVVLLLSVYFVILFNQPVVEMCS